MTAAKAVVNGPNAVIEVIVASVVSVVSAAVKVAAAMVRLKAEVRTFRPAMPRPAAAVVIGLNGLNAASAVEDDPVNAEVSSVDI